jgi:hypothetical protein
MGELLYTVEDIFKSEGYLKDPYGYYNIPVYQRGYKWEPKVVKKLLVDIDNFNPEGHKFYCLQNITIVPKEEEKCFNVVDGQQRLTTMVVLLSFLGKKELVKNKVVFPKNSIREETNRFINELITNNGSDLAYNNWDIFTAKNPNYDHQDIYYLFSTYNTIKSWFEQKTIESAKFDKSQYLVKLLENVKFIVNRIDGENDEEKIFGNLNTKRVPLDGADLVRAILITRVAFEEQKREDDIKNVVRVNERRVRIGWELDEINNWWSQPDVNAYFREFISIKSEEISEGNKLFKEDKYPLNLLLLLFAETYNETSLTLEFIEKRSNEALVLYRELMKLNSTLQDWFKDQEIYHFLGYLFSQTNLSFNDVWKGWKTAESRDSFKSYLKGKIKSEIFGDKLAELENEDIDWYYDDKARLIKILILLDVILSVKSGQPYMPVASFHRYGYDVEHIFPQNPKEVKDKKSYIEFLNKYVLKQPDNAILLGFAEKINDPAYQEEIENYIQLHTDEIRIHSIGNLVLLDSSKNRSISNNPYYVKRGLLISDINRGVFMRPHTLKVFVRYFDTGMEANNDSSHWTNNDINANEKAIFKTISSFLNK